VASKTNLHIVVALSPTGKDIVLTTSWLVVNESVNELEISRATDDSTVELIPNPYFSNPAWREEDILVVTVSDLDHS
jgi:hypothetical protein